MSATSPGPARWYAREVGAWLYYKVWDRLGIVVTTTKRREAREWNAFELGRDYECRQPVSKTTREDAPEIAAALDRDYFEEAVRLFYALTCPATRRPSEADQDDCPSLLPEPRSTRLPRRVWPGLAMSTCGSPPWG